MPPDHELDLWMEALSVAGPVSRETAAQFQTYEALLAKWQRAINLVSGATLAQARRRHFADSAQLVPLIEAAPGTDSAKVIFDLGSGAGFPGLVLALLRPHWSVHLIESDRRKGSFLKTVSRETAAGAQIHVLRIEQAAADLTEAAVRPDIVTARALAPLEMLLGYSAPWAAANPQLRLLFLKGAQADSEIAQARQYYDFDCEKIPSRTDQGASILVISGLSAKAGS